MSTQVYDLLVVGGGALGTFHAYHALQRGLRVALVERHSQPQGATVRNFGQVVPSGQNAEYQRYGRKSLEVYQSLQAQGEFSIRQLGSIYLASDAEEMQLVEELAAINRSNDYRSEVWTKAQCYAKYPDLHPNYCVGGLFFPEEISVNPRMLIHRVLAYLRTFSNFTYFPNTLIQSIDSAGAHCVTTDLNGNTYTAEKVIVCGGHEFQWLYPEIFQRSDIELVKLQMLRLKPQQSVKIPGNILTGLSIRRYESFEACPSYAEIHAREAQDTFWKQWSVHILFKQEDDGSIVLGDSHQYTDVQQQDGLDFYIREDVTRYFIEEGAKIFNLEHWNIDDQWLGIYSQCKEHDIFQATVNGKVHIATAIGGKGMTASAGFSFDNIAKIYGKH
ncbi:MAG: N-methyl-L-tryptophan oxidase [Bacteroidota bacterium]|jgi:FAD dependent oxidoreductase TIGR03364